MSLGWPSYLWHFASSKIFWGSNVAGQRQRNSVRTFVCPPGWPSNPAGWPSDPSCWPLDPSSWPSDYSSCLSEPAGPKTYSVYPQTPPAGTQTPPAFQAGKSEGPNSKLEGFEGQPVGCEGQPEGGGQVDGQIDRGIIGISAHSTELCPLLRPLPFYPLRLHNIKVAGQGNC